jgi:hypothetical protein
MSNFPWGQLVLGLVGATLGAAAGYYLYGWILSQGYDAGVLPGAMLGAGFGLVARKQRQTFGVLCCVLGTLFGFFCEWSYFPFVDDGSLPYFATHLQDLKPIKIIMIAIGGAAAFVLGRGRATDPFDSGV